MHLRDVVFVCLCMVSIKDIDKSCKAWMGVQILINYNNNIMVQPKS